jgi:DNA-binding NarL/FixJ family response regulator
MARRPRSPLHRIAVAARLGDADLSQRLVAEVSAATDLVWNADNPDVLIVDNASPTTDESRPLVLLGEGDPSELPGAVRAVLPGDASPTTIVSTARLVAEGLLVLTDNALERLAEIAAEREDFDERSGSMVDALTPREKQVLELLAAGASNKAIARQLDVSVHTVKFHVASLLRKLGASGRLEAVGIGLRTGLLML